MVFDWKNAKEEALQQGIIEKKYGLEFWAKNSVLRDCTFRNFPKLRICATVLIDCTFEDCGDISIDEGKAATDCVFRRIGSLEVFETDIYNSLFTELNITKDQAIDMRDGTIAHCTFENINLYYQSYLCEGTGIVTVEDCRFKNIRTSRKDKALFHCEETVGHVFKKKQEFEIVDEGSCTGLDAVLGLEDACVPEE